MSGVLEEVLGKKFAPQKDKLAEIFSGMWSLEEYENDAKVQDVVKQAINDPKNFVVKP